MLAEKLKIFVTTKENLDYVRLCGVIDEDNNLLGVLPRLTRPVVVVAMREVTRINSCGVRDWVNWMSAVESTAKKVVLYECSPSVVSQINLVANFAGKALVESFLAPYFCSTCDTERFRLIQTRRLSAERPRAPRALCDECDSLMTLDEVEESYFSFVPRTRPAANDAIVENALAELTPTIDEKLLLIDYTADGRTQREQRPSVTPTVKSAPTSPVPSAPPPATPLPPQARSAKSASPPAFSAELSAPAASGMPSWFWPVIAGAVLASAAFAFVWAWLG
jgi:anti-anti-sigma regulatory factor